MPGAAKIRIAVIEESALLRAGISLLLSGHPGFEVIGTAGSQSEALSLIERDRPDVAVWSVGPNGGKDLERLPEILEAAEFLRVLVLTEPRDQELNRRAIRFGAVGLVSKSNPPEVLMKAVEKVHAGEAWLDHSMTASVLHELSTRNKTHKRNADEIRMERLTNREREIIQLAGEGLKNGLIAERLFISTITVHHHITSIYSKLEVADRFELLIYAYRNGLAKLPR
jgi:DNA-binding NarL/FixJ family response regulator